MVISKEKYKQTNSSAFYTDQSKFIEFENGNFLILLRNSLLTTNDTYVEYETKKYNKIVKENEKKQKAKKIKTPK